MASVDDRLAAIPQLDTSADEFRALLDAVPDALVVIEVTDAESKGLYPFIAVNDDACQMFGYTREQLLERDLADLWVNAEYGEHLRDRLLAGDTPRTSAELRRSDGSTVKVDVTTRVRALGDRLVVIATAREIPDSTKLENELRRSRDRLELSESFARAGSVDWDLVTGEERWSDGMYDILGIPKGSVKPCLESFRKYVHPADREAAEVSTEQVGKGAEEVEGPIRMILASGDERVFNVRMRGFTDWTGEIVRVYVTIQDVTDQQAARTQIETVERRLSAAQKVAHVGSIDWDLRSGESWWSEEFYRILGLPPSKDEPALRTYLDVVHEDDRQFVIDRLREMQATGEGRSDDVRIRHPDGEERVINATTIIVTDDDGKAIRQLTTIHDITERKRMEERLRSSEAFLRKAQTVAGLGSWSVDLATGSVTWSEELYLICGVTPQTWDGRVESFLDDICHREDRAEAESAWQLMASTGEAHQTEYRVRRPDREIRHLLTRGQIVRDSEGRPRSVVGASQDITEIRLAQEALRVSEERLELATYGSSDGLWDWPDISGDYLWVSPRYAELLGYTPEEFSLTAKSLTDAIHPDDRKQAHAHRRAHFERRAPFDLELRMRTRGGEYRWFRMRGNALRDATGRPVRMAGSLLDIHGTKTAEAQLHKYQSRLRSLAASVSEAAEKERRRIAGELHDRTVQTLGALRMTLDVLRRPGPIELADERRDEIFALIDSAIHETRELLQEIGPPVLYELGFAAAVDWLGERAQKQYRVRCRTTFESEEAAIPDEVQMVLFVSVRELLRNVGKHARASNAHVSVASLDDGLVVEVSDDGIGFQTSEITDAPTPAGGYGLFSVRESMRVVGGTLEVESGPDHGSCVRLHVPVLK